MAKKYKEMTPTGLYLVAIVGIVAVFGLVVLVMNVGGGAMSYDDLAGQAWARSAGIYTPSYSTGVYTAYDPYRPRYAAYNPLDGPYDEVGEAVPDEQQQLSDDCVDYDDCTDECEDVFEDAINQNACYDWCNTYCP